MASATRMRQTWMSWPAAIGAGVIAGVVFLILEMVMVAVFLGGSPWGPSRMIGAIVLGKRVLPPPATFNVGVVVTAMIVHMLLSVIYALILSAIVHRMGTGAAVGIGAVFGLVLYLVNFHIFTGLFPWFANARNWVTVFAHIVFGLVAAWAYNIKVCKSQALVWQPKQVENKQKRTSRGISGAKIRGKPCMRRPPTSHERPGLIEQAEHDAVDQMSEQTT